MSTDSKNSAATNVKALTPEEREKINEVRSAVTPLPEKLSGYCSDAPIVRYLRGQSWNVKKATKVLKETVRWRSEYKPENICWEDISFEAESGKMYLSSSVDKKGRPVIVMRPCHQNSNSVEEQMKYFVYCMENAILGMPPDQEQMIWLVDFRNYSMSNLSFKAAKETANILQNYYPDRLGVAIMYNPPWIFEKFYKMVKPFLESSIQEKVKFIYAGDNKSMEIMEDLFHMDQLESAFGGKAAEDFEIDRYAQRMKEDDQRRLSLYSKGDDTSVSRNCSGVSNVSSLSDKGDPSEEEKKKKNDDRSTPQTADDSKGSSPILS